MVLNWFKRAGNPSKKAEDAYLSGIDSLIQHDTDRAIEELIKLAKLNPEVAETYLALGNLFRSKGDTEKAIQVHQTLMRRAGIDKSLKVRAQFNLALDFRKAGFIERAMSAFEAVLAERSDHLPSLDALVELYEESHEWEKAMAIAEKIGKLRKYDNRNVIAHHLTELGKQLQNEGADGPAVKAFKKAISKDPNCLDAYLHMGDHFLEKGKPEKAVETWKKVLDIQSELSHLTYPRMEKAYRQMNAEDKFEQFLEDMRHSSRANIFSMLALASIWLDRGDIVRARNELEEILQRQPSFWEARILLGKIVIEAQDHEKALDQYREIIEILAPTETNFQCLRCGHEAHTLAWKCPRCRAWDTIALKPFLSSGGNGE